MAQWTLDPAHSEIKFKVKHLVISIVTGQFMRFRGTVDAQKPDFSDARMRFEADVDSISTNNEQRDAHLKNGDFFDAGAHPQLIFEADGLEKTDDEHYELYGMLTMRGITRKVKLNVEYGGTTQDPWGNTRIGFSLSGKVNRKDFGISFGLVSETGGILLSDEVRINANAEFVRQAERKAA